MTELPEVHEIVRWHPEPGDILIARNTELVLNADQAQEVALSVRAHLGVPPHVTVVAIGRDWEFTVGKLPE
jgi:hypothetical protein